MASSDPLECGCLKDVVYGEREYSCDNSTGDGVSQSEVLSKLINTGTFIKNQCSRLFGDGSQLEYLQAIENPYASTFTYNDVVTCIGSNVSNLEQLKVALENVNQMRITSYGLPIFDVTSATLFEAGTVGIGENWLQIGFFAVGLANSAYKAPENVGDIFAYLAIEDSNYCRAKYLKKYDLRVEEKK